VRRIVLLFSLVASLALAGGAAAAAVVSQDHQGRPIRFDVKTEGVDAEWYAALLRDAPHGDEIATLRIDVVSWVELHSICGDGAGGCYSRNVMVVPPDQDAQTAHTLVHEYGHHLDRSRPVAGAAEPNGTPEWFRARGVAELLRLRSVARDYSLDWDRSIAEIFAEDYARLALGGATTFKIRWLAPPDATVLSALQADLGLGPPPAVVNPPVLKPLTIVEKGSLAPRKRVSIPFRLLGPGRRVTATATLGGAKEKRARATLELRCDGDRVALRTIGSGQTLVRIDQRDLGPAQCTAVLASTSSFSRGFTLNLRLTVVPSDA